MRLYNAFGVPLHLVYIVRIAFLPTLREVFRAPWLLLHPIELSRLSMSFVWGLIGKGMDEGCREIKTALITSHAYGVVLDIGAGYGHTIKYLDKTKVTKYIALEPNTRMHNAIRKEADLVGFDEEQGNLLLLSYGAEDTGLILSAVGGPHSVDTMISILTFCSVPQPENTISALIDQVLKPGGQLLYFEHVQSGREDVAWWQHFWSPIWGMAFDGCVIGRPTDAIIERLGVWKGKDVTRLEDAENTEDMFVHCIGRLTKNSAVSM